MKTENKMTQLMKERERQLFDRNCQQLDGFKAGFKMKAADCVLALENLPQATKGEGK